jgi:hypothetical protein
MLAPMKNVTQKTRSPLPPFQSGQIWKMKGSNVEIGLVGKRLVHYKYYQGQTKGSPTPTSLTGKDALEKFLQEKRAVLVPA